MNYEQTIDYLYDQLPMYSRVGAAAYKEDLHNTILLCQALGNPQCTFKTIHIAGTNGKGSTSHMLAAILQQAGYKTGLYTSPHLKDFRERIKINGEKVSKAFVVEFVAKIKDTSEQIEPSFFELTVAMCFEYFAKEKVDIAIIETGLGGRLDSTNIIHPILSVITNIGFDHMNHLGNTLPQIATEKAGIIKSGVPVVIGEYLPPTKDIFLQKAQQQNAPLVLVQDHYKVNSTNYSQHYLTCEVTASTQHTNETYQLDLNGFYQAKNLCTVLAVASLLIQQKYTITTESIKFALANTKKLTGLHGRWDVISSYPTIVLDVAHNADGMQQILQQIELLKSAKSKLHFVIGMVNDKDISSILSLLPRQATFYFTNAHIPRALPHTSLKEKAAAYELYGQSFDDVNTAIKMAKASAHTDDLIIVCGSVFVVGEVNTELFS